MSLRMNKKAFEIQFNWIFVLVAGAAIILLFTSIVIKQKNIAETSTKSTVLKSVDAIITGASVSTDTTNIITIPNSNIEVSCNRISISGISRQYEHLILYAPSLMKGDKLITQTLTFSVPYRATNLLLVTSPQLRYIIVGSNNLAKEINKSMPAELKKEFYQNTPQIRNSNNYKVRLVLIEDMIDFPESLEKMPDNDVSAININGDKEKGAIEFWQKNGNSWQHKGTSSYIGKPSLIAAVYTDNIESYECNMQNTFTRLNLVTRIFVERTKKLMEKELVSIKEIRCKELYTNALFYFNKILTASLNFNDENVNKISDSAKSLASNNKDAQLNSCTLLY